jgi:hypothetical protein
MLLADFLGTTWWTVLCIGGGFIAGVAFSGWVKSFLNK